MSFSLVLAVASFLSSSVHAFEWDGYNNPANMDSHYEYNYDRLPKSGKLNGPLPWSETFWPAKKGSVNIRWNTPDQPGFNYTPPTQEEVATMKREDLAKLAPTEKYDIAMGRYDYPLFWEATGWADPKAEDWNGMCDGWSMAAIQYPEPAAVDVVNPDGITVPFGSSDVKGLMTFAAAAYFKADSRQVGSRCWKKKPRPGEDYDCDDINAGALHVILANQIGIKQQAFIVERDPTVEIWNQPVFGFEFRELGSSIPDSGSQGILIHGTLYYTDELDRSEWSPVGNTAKFQFAKLEMDYILDLDENRNVIGGHYVNNSDHPDFVWMPVNHLEFNGYMQGLSKIYRPAI